MSSAGGRIGHAVQVTVHVRGVVHDQPLTMSLPGVVCAPRRGAVPGGKIGAVGQDHPALDSHLSTPPDRQQACSISGTICRYTREILGCDTPTISAIVVWFTFCRNTIRVTTTCSRMFNATGRPDIASLPATICHIREISAVNCSASRRVIECVPHRLPLPKIASFGTSIFLNGKPMSLNDTSESDLINNALRIKNRIRIQDG